MKILELFNFESTTCGPSFHSEGPFTDMILQYQRLIPWWFHCKLLSSSWIPHMVIPLIRQPLKTFRAIDRQQTIFSIWTSGSLKREPVHPPWSLLIFVCNCLRQLSDTSLMQFWLLGLGRGRGQAKSSGHRFLSRWSNLGMITKYMLTCDLLSALDINKYKHFKIFIYKYNYEITPMKLQVKHNTNPITEGASQ